MDNQQPKDPLGILKQKPAKVSESSDPLGILKKNKSLVSEDGGKAGISAPPSDSGKGFGELKPAKRQPAEVIKEPKVVGEDTLLARKMEREQRPVVSTTGVKLPAAPKVVAEEKAAERALAPKLEPRVAKDEQGWLANTVSALDRGFYKNLIGNPIKGLATVVQYGTEAMTGGRVKEGPVSDALNKFGDWFNNAIDEVAPQDPEFKNSLSDQFAQALGQVGSIVLTGGFGAGGRATGIATQAVPSAGRLAPAVAAGKELVSEITSPAAISAGLTMGQAEFDRAKKAGASDDQAFEAFYKNAAVGSILEKIPVMQFFKRFNNATAGGVANYIKNKGVAGITGGLEEATTEVLQQVYANKTAKDIYNTNQDIFEGLTESGGIGFGVGFLLNAMGANAKLLRKQGKEAEAQLVDAQIKEFESRAEKGPEVPPAPAVAPEMTQYTMEAPRLAGEPEQISKPIELSIEPQIPAAERKNWTEQQYKDEIKRLRQTGGSEPLVQELINELGQKAVADIEAEKARAGEKVQKKAEVQNLQGAINRYEEGKIETFDDLVNEVEAIADSENNQSLKDAVADYREEQRYNESLKGRGDVDAAEDAFLSKIRGVGEVTPEAAPEVPAAPEAPIPPSGFRPLEGFEEFEVVGPKKEAPKTKEETDLRKRALNLDVEGNIRGEVLQYFIGNGTVSPEAIKRLFQRKDNNIRWNNMKPEERKTRIGFMKKGSPDIEALAEKLAGADRLDITQDFRNAIEDVLLGSGGKRDMAKELVESYDAEYKMMMRDRELAELGEEMERQVQEFTAGLPEAQKKEIIEVLDEFRFEDGSIDWARIERELEAVDPFSPEIILRLSPETQKTIQDGIKQIKDTGRVSRVPVETAPSPEALRGEARAAEATDKRTEAKNQLRDAFNDLMNLGVAYDPRSQAEKQVRLTKAIINVIKQEAISAIKDLQKYIKDNLGFDISDKDAKYLLTESKKPEYAIQEPTAGEVPVQPEARVGEEVAAGVPPTEPPKAPEEGKVESEEKRVSGIKKALVSKEVLESVDLDRTGDKQLLMAGRQIIESGEVEPKLLVDKIIDEGRGVLSPAEVVAMITYKADLDTKIEDLTAEIEQLEASGQDIGTKGVELKNLQVDQRNFEIAAVITAQQQSMSFRLRRWMLDRSYNLQTEIARYKRNNNGVIPEDVQKKFEEYDAQIQELKKKIREAETRKADQEGEQAAANIVEDVQREGKTLSDEEIEAKVQEGVQAEINKIYEQLPAKRKSKADQAIAALEKIQKRLRSRTYDASIGIPVAIIDTGITAIKSAIKAGVAIEKAIQIGIDKIKQQLKGKPFENEDKFRQDLLDGFKAEGIKAEPEKSETPSINDDGTLNIPEKFLRNLVRGGVTTIDGMTDAVFKELEPQLPGLTKRQVRDAITEYGKTVNPTKDEIREQVNTAKRLGRLISELEDLQTMGAAEFALKYFKKKPSRITEAEKNLKGQIRVLAKKMKTDPQRLAEAKEAAKRRIEELQRRLKEGDFSRREKPVIKADAELEILVGQKEALQDKFDEEQKKAELKNRTTLQKLEDVALEIFSGIPRALVAGFDLSAAFVQGTFRVFTNPVLSAKAFAEGIRQFASQGRQDKWLQRLRGTYNYTIIRNSGLAITDPDGKLSAKEQIFVVNWANTIYDTMANIVTFGHKPSAEFIKRINPLKASQRAFDGYVNYIRVSTFLKMAESLKNDGYTPDSNPEVYKKAADWINTSTGRANLGALEGSSKWLSTIFFAPRKVLAELKLFTPYAFVYYSYLPAPVRKRALTDFAKFATSVLVTHLIIKAALETYGEEEKDEEFWNPDSPNFLSFKIGEKRLSFLGGSKATLVFMSRLLVGNEFVDQYGVETKFGERVGKKINTKFDLIVRYFAGKASPSVGAIRDYTDKNPNYENDDEIFQNLVIPMWLQDSQELYKEDPIAVTGMFNALAIIGANVRKVDVAQVQDQIVFKEKVNKKEVKRTIKLTDAQKEEFQNIVDSKFKAKIAKISKELKSAQSQAQRAEYTKLAADMAKKEAQDILEKRYKIQFRQFPIQEKEQDVIKEKVKKKLK